MQKDIYKEKIKMDDLGSTDKTAEEEHFLGDYVQLLLNLVKVNWPGAFPDLVLRRIKHEQCS